MVTALIFAGGTGSRMNSKTKPKQFLELYGKPIIIHTIEWFEAHEEVDNIVVVCIENWIDYLKDSLRRNGIGKVSHIVSGGKTGQESIYNGLKKIYENCDEPKKEIVLIHDGVRPLISEQLITDNIEAVKKYGSAITVAPAKETVVILNEDKNQIAFAPERALCAVAKAPQSFYLEDVIKAYECAKSEEFDKAVDSATIMLHYGHKLHTVKGNADNIKITTPSDYYIFRAIYEARENSQILGL